MPFYTRDANGNVIPAPEGVSVVKFMEKIESEIEAREEAKKEELQRQEKMREYQDMLQQEQAKLQERQEALKTILYFDVRICAVLAIFVEIVYFKHFHLGSVLAECRLHEYDRINGCKITEYTDYKDALGAWFDGMFAFLLDGIDSKMSVFLFGAPCLAALALFLRFRLSAALLCTSVGLFATYAVSGEFHFWLALGAVVGPVFIIFFVTLAVAGAIVQAIISSILQTLSNIFRQ